MTLKLTGIYNNEITDDFTVKTANLIVNEKLSSDMLSRKANHFAEDHLLSESDAVVAELPSEILAAFPALAINEGVWSADMGGAIGYVIAQYAE